VTQISEAVQLVKDDLVKQLTDESWNVQSLNGENNYKVKVADSVHAYDLWCTCSAWRFKKGEKDCKHCEAVRQIDKGNNVPTKQTITKPSKSSQLKTTNPFLKLAGQLNEVADSWDRLDQKVCCDILEELGYDSEVAYQKNFKNLGDKVQKVIAKDYLKGWRVCKSKTIKQILMDKPKTSKPKRSVSKKNIKVTCWHCGDTNQKILSYEEAFMCDKCKELLWTGDGGFEEIKVGVWR